MIMKANKQIGFIYKDNESIDVRGRSVDKDGIESGYNYDEFYIKSVNNTSFRVKI